MENFKLKDKRIMRKNLEFYILFSPNNGVLQFCVLCKLGLIFQLVFWGGTCFIDSQVALPGWSCTTPCQEARLSVSCFGLFYVGLFPEVFPCCFRL